MNIIARLSHVLEFQFYKKFGFPVVRSGNKSASKKALLVYLSIPLKWKKNDPRFNWHQNYNQSCQIVALLEKRGYCVDVVQYNDKKFMPQGHYDLIITHSGLVEKRLQDLPKTQKRICIRTGSYADFVNTVMNARYARLNEKMKCSFSWKEVGAPDDEFKKYDAIACFDANGATSSSYKNSGIPVYSFRNQATVRIKYVKEKSRDAHSGYLYIAAHLHVLKGLDWLIEIFAQRPDQHLYICGTISPELKELYVSELALPNIHEMGFVEVESREFNEICKKVSWYVSPSASEGCQGAALDMMAAGLIPILSKACGVDTYGVGIGLEPCTMDKLEVSLDQTSQESMEKIREQSLSAREVINNHYRQEHFIDDWSRILDQLDLLECEFTENNDCYISKEII